MRNYPGTILHYSRHLSISRPCSRAHNYSLIPPLPSPHLLLRPFSPTCSTLYSTRQHSHTPRGDPSHPPGEDEGLLKRGWRQLATLISAFMTGTKSLYKDVKVMYELKRRHRLVITGAAPKTTGPSTTDLGFNRAELQFIYQTQKDMKKMLPTIVLFFIPFFGYFVPLIVFMYPHRMLSSHFLTGQQKTELLRAASATRAAHLTSLLSRTDYFDQLRQLETCLKNGLERGGQEREDVERESRDELMSSSLKSVKGQILDDMCGMWGVAGGILPRLLPWVRGSTLRVRLETHLHYIFTTDCLVKMEGGLTSLEKEDLEKLCLERCLVSDEEGEMEEYLHKWVHISSQFQECPPYLLAHLPLLLQLSQQRTQ